MSNVTTERRAHARRERRFELEGTLPAGGDVARMLASNLSLGGLYCTSPIGYDEMTRLEVRLLLPTAEAGQPEPIDLQAIVVRRRELPDGDDGQRYELALFFTGIDEERREKLSAYLTS